MNHIDGIMAQLFTFYINIGTSPSHHLRAPKRLDLCRLESLKGSQPRRALMTSLHRVVWL